jgi:hypothetical protein
MSDSAGCSFFGEEFCVFCHLAFDEDKCKMVTVRHKSLQNIVEHCILRNDLALKYYLDSKPSNVNVHAECRKAYTKPCRKSAALETNTSVEGQSTKRLRSSCNSFDWHVNCVFCGKVVVSGRSDTHSAQTLNVKKTVEKKCLERQDEWAMAILDRINTCLDFPSSEAAYHGQCQVNFYAGRQMPGSSVLREEWRQHDTKRENFERMCQWLEREAGDELHSVNELRQKMVEECGEEEQVYTVRWLKQLLKEKIW